ncbi:hypothetical protein DFH28DRAFT_1181617 [Melampsora americana]|nr:hypothetical protein DFH28DRAFT_1181617 [Melampsora americana]
MTSSVESRLLNYLNNLPSDSNPYVKVAKYIRDQLQTCPTPVWARCIDGLIGILFFTLLIQSCKIISTRVKTKKFYLFKLNTLGLIKFDGINHGCVAYSLCSIAFLWLCFCHYVAVKFDPLKSQRPGKETLISPIIIWSLNLSFLAMMFGPIIPMYWVSFGIDAQYVYITKHLAPILQQLSDSASTYSPTTYSQLKILKILLPAQDLIPHIFSVEYYFRAALMIYLVDASIISVLYPIALFLIFRSLSKYDKLSEKVKSQNRLTAERGFVTCISAIHYLVVIAWLVGEKSYLNMIKLTDWLMYT